MEAPDDWSRIDPEAKGKAASGYLSRTALHEAGVKEYLRSLLNLQGSERVLDAGCGIGIDSLELARTVPRGRVRGVDLSGELISNARARAKAAGISNAEFIQGDIVTINLGTGTFDAIHCQRTLQHIPDAGAALRNLLRLAKPGARFLLYEPDQASTIIYPGDERENRIILDLVAGMGPHKGTMGRKLPALASSIGLVGIEVYLFPAHYTTLAALVERATMDPHRLFAFVASSGSLDEKRLKAWMAEMEEASHRGEFFAANLNVAISGRAPE